jgi:anaerobic ribonucleoside-triphosphate reductase
MDIIRKYSQILLYDKEKLMNNQEEITMGENVGFERIRRITGYLVGTMDKWNDAKKSEEKDRVKYGLGNKNA